ncbi:MAG: glycosyltransferase family 2 protein [Janthinobacterium lividum]
MPSIGVGITTYNRKWKLEETLARLRAVTPEPFDLVVADDGSSDGTVEYLAGTGLDYVTGRNRGVAWNKNRALYTLFRRGHDAIVLLEDDAFPAEAGWLTMWAEAARRYDHMNYAGEWFPPHIFLRGSGSLDDPFLTTASTAQVSAFSRRAIERAGFFDTRFRGYGHEHVDLTQRMIREGMGGFWDPARDDGGYEYLSLAGGMQPTADSSFADEGQVTANGALFDMLRDEPAHRDPWQDEAERAVLLAEVEAVAAAPAGDVNRTRAFFHPVPPSPQRSVLSLRFREGEAALGCLGEGWGMPEQDGLWAVGEESEIRLRVDDFRQDGAGAAPGYELSLAMTPFDRPQNVTILLNGFDMGRRLASFGVETMVAFPASLVAAGGVLRVRLVHPEGVRPADLGRGDDVRVLSLWLMSLSIRTLSFAPALWGESVEHMAPKDLMQRFRCLGDNAEFSVVQHRSGLEVPTLFRHARMSMAQIAHGLARRFEGVDDPATLRVAAVQVYEGPPDYLGFQDAYSLGVMADVKEGAMPPERVHAILVARMSVMRKLLLDDLAEGSRIFVLRREAPLAEAEVVPIWSLLRGLGQAALLYVTLADEGHPPGSVELRRDGLYCGRLDRLPGQDELGDPSLEVWLAVCRATYSLWLEERRQGRKGRGSASSSAKGSPLESIT